MLAPGGLGIVTTQGNAALETIRASPFHQKMFGLSAQTVADIIATFEESPFVFVPYDDATARRADAGADYGSTFIHPDYIRSRWESPECEVVEILPGGLRGWQDIVVLRRR